MTSTLPANDDPSPFKITTNHDNDKDDAETQFHCEVQKTVRSPGVASEPPLGSD